MCRRSVRLLNMMVKYDFKMCFVIPCYPTRLWRTEEISKTFEKCPSLYLILLTEVPMFSIKRVCDQYLSILGDIQSKICKSLLKF